MTVFIRLLDFGVSEKASALKEEVQNGLLNSYFVDAGAFNSVPGSPFAYWGIPRLLESFGRYSSFENNYRSARQGGVNGDDFRWLRLWSEVCGRDAGSIEYLPIAKGGAFAKYYGLFPLVVRWDRSAGTFVAFTGLPHRPSVQPASSSYYFRPGLTWPRRTDGLSFKVMPRDCVFADKGPAIFVESDGSEELLALCAVVNSKPFEYLVGLQLARTELAQSFEVGLIQKTPIPDMTDAVKESLARLSERAWQIQRMSTSTVETSHAFVLPEAEAIAIGLFSRAESEVELRDIQLKINIICFSLYGVNSEDQDLIQNPSRGGLPGTGEASHRNSGGDDDDEGSDERLGRTSELQALLSWSVGVAFARFDIRLATGERAVPPEPDPFDPLPAKSPGMLPDGDAPFMPTSGVFVDDPGHADDLAARVTAVYERVGEAPPVPDELRRTLAKDFFPAHIRMYSKSRRKAPIYWQLATPSASYSVWLYIHALGKDTLFRVQNDYVAPKLAHERRELEGLLAEAGPSPTTAQSRAIEAQATFVEELSALLDEVKRVAPLWDPDLDDGVILNFAPLWRLAPQNRAWQKELRAAWAALVDGDYDWAHLSMRLWPERVVLKCAKDRSLAIAHDLEDAFWFEDAAGKWQARPTPTRSIDDLIAERTSPAVKAALQSLLEAPDPVAASARGRRKKT
jgi:hypothetical protein